MKKYNYSGLIKVIDEIKTNQTKAVNEELFLTKQQLVDLENTVFVYAAFSMYSMYEGVIIAPSAEKARDKLVEFYYDKEGSAEVDDMSFRVIPLKEDHRYDSDYPMLLEMIERERTEDEKLGKIAENTEKQRNKNQGVVELQIAEYDEEEYCTMHYFKVSRDWLENHLNDVGFTTVDTFLEEYTSDESDLLYAQAVLENAVVDESYEK